MGNAMIRAAGNGGITLLTTSCCGGRPSTTASMAFKLRTILCMMASAPQVANATDHGRKLEAIEARRWRTLRGLCASGARRPLTSRNTRATTTTTPARTSRGRERPLPGCIVTTPRSKSQLAAPPMATWRFDTHVTCPLWDGGAPESKR